MRLHFHQPANSALELLRQALTAIYMRYFCSGGYDQLDPALIEFIHQSNEAACLILMLASHHRNIGKQYRLKGLR